MGKKGIQQKKKQAVHDQRVAERIENREDGKSKALNPDEIRRARAKPLSFLGNKALGELDMREKGPKSFTEFVTEKAKKRGLQVPTDPVEAREFALAKLKPPPGEPPPYWFDGQ